MRWFGESQSGNVEDRRGMGGGGKLALGGGLGGVVIIILSLIMGKNPMDYINAGSDAQTDTQTGQYQSTPEEDKQMQFVGVVLKETEDVWTKVFADEGKTYEDPKL